jgi:hypothetical protein
MPSSVGLSGPERFAQDVIADNLYYTHPKTGEMTLLYAPYPKLLTYHRSPKKHRLTGGAAYGGKTLGLLMDHMMEANSFTDPSEARQVHTLLLRRTHPKLEATVITRFREKFPREVYKDYNEQKKIVTWLNGSQTHFGSMQYEHDAYGWQGQWLKIDYDEICEFTFKQWFATSAWNRCPVSPYSTKGGAGNPIGPGAGWCKSLFVDKVAFDEMDDSQRREYNPDDYEYFPFTYLDNPIAAKDTSWLESLQQYSEAERRALMMGEWGVAGGYFSGAWDPAANVYDDDKFKIQPWFKRWLGGDWGHEDWAANYWFCMDDYGIIRIYREGVTNHLSPGQLAEYIVKKSFDDDGQMPHFERFMYSHDAFHQKQDANTVALQMGRVLRQNGLPSPTNAGTDKIGREQLFYQLLKAEVVTGEGYDAETGQNYPIKQRQLQIARSCTRLIQNIPLAPRAEGTNLGEEKIDDFPGDDMIDGAGHGLYGMARNPADKPYKVRLAEAIQPLPVEGTARYIKHLTMNQKEKENNGGAFFIRGIPRRRR